MANCNQKEGRSQVDIPYPHVSWMGGILNQFSTFFFFYDILLCFYALIKAALSRALKGASPGKAHDEQTP